MLAKTTLDADQVKQAEQLARSHWGENSLEPHFAALIERPELVVALNRKSYLLAAAPQQEANVADALREAGFDVFLPREPKSIRMGHVKRRTILRPMLPGYVFPIFDEHRDNWRIIHKPDADGNGGIRGVLRMFLWGERPVPVPEKAIQDLRDHEIEAEMRGKARKSTTAIYVAMPGHFVQIDDGGPWNGFIGEVVDLLARGARIIVSLDLFGRQTPVEVSVNQVRAV